MVVSLRSLKGNARGAVFTEALWGIPFNLYAPYVSLYMLKLGLDDEKIGLIISIGLVCQIITSSLSGVITDKFGRKRTTFISDLLSWSVPVLIWAFAQNFTYFLIAAVISSLWRISANSWMCVMVEDTDPDQLVDIYTWIYISGLLAAFFAPLAGVLIQRFTLIPTMRGLYLFAFVMMTLKFIAMNAMVTETGVGRQRMQATKGQNIFAMLGEYRGVAAQILRTPETLFTVGIMLVTSVAGTINSGFWSILVTKKIHIPEQDLALYPFAKSILMLFFYFLVMPKIRGLHFKYPMLVGFAGSFASQALLILVPEKSYLLLLVSVLLDACSIASVSAFLDKMIVVSVDPEERARIMAILYVIVIMVTSPFGWIAGMLSEMNRILPFVLNLVLLVIAGVLTFLAARHGESREAELTEDEVSLEISG